MHCLTTNIWMDVAPLWIGLGWISGRDEVMMLMFWIARLARHYLPQTRSHLSLLENYPGNRNHHRQSHNHILGFRVWTRDVTQNIAIITDHADNHLPLSYHAYHHNHNHNNNHNNHNNNNDKRRVMLLTCSLGLSATLAIMGLCYQVIIVVIISIIVVIVSISVVIVIAAIREDT